MPWQTNIVSQAAALDIHLVPEITATGVTGGTVRLDYITAASHVDAWFTLATLMLTNSSQPYYDISAIGQPQRLYRIVPLP